MRINLPLPALIIIGSLLLPGHVDAKESDRFLRERMVSRQIEARGIRDTAVLEAMREVPRHLFVPEKVRSESYDDHPLPIGLGQTISQPYIVAFMTNLLKLKPDHRVFELGTGSGYQAAVASRLVKDVFTVEIYEKLADSAARRLVELGYENVHVRSGDGYYGWEEKAPFDAIIVTAAADHIPPPLIRQLRPGGRLIIPLCGPFAVHQRVLVTKDADGSIKKQAIILVRFVPLLGH
ncbi:MAG: protein-L-isoaspartate(D-aspartate) O-methyltransferase [Bacteroidetes bacterium]|nr:MAG: protein-L-isoaspartate(D-aspartate) O-methyltransferase [Bacteroidota bacterium]